MNISKKNRYIIDLSIIFILCFIPRLIMILLYAAPLRTPVDEMSTIATGAFAAGYDWSTAAQVGGRYYGGGYAILFAPLFKLINDPLTLYKVMLSVSALLQTLTGMIAYHVLYKYLRVSNRTLCVLAGIALSYMQIIRSMMFYNEHMLMLIVWICILLLCRLVANTDQPKKRIADSILLMLILSYSLTLHTRMKTFWIALVIVVILYRIFYKRMMISVIPAILTGIAGYYAAGRFIYWAKTNVWLWSEGEFLRNASVNLNLSLDLLKSPISWSAWFDTVLGQVHISTIFTGGLTAILIPCFLTYLFRSWKILKKNPMLPPCTQKEESIRPYLLVISIFSALFIGAMIFAQSLTWLDRVTSALQQESYGGNGYGFKAFTYIRYYAICLGPFVMCGLAIIYHCRDILKENIWKIISFFLILQGLFFFCILPHITNSTWTSAVYAPFALSGDQEGGGKIYIIGIVICCLLFAALLGCFFKEHFVIPLLLLCLLMPYQYFYNGIHSDGAKSAENQDRINSTISLLSELKANYADFPDTIYLANMGTSSFTTQYLMPDTEINPHLPKVLLETGIIIASSNNKKSLISAGYRYTEIADHEYLYVKGSKYIEMLEASGFTFS